MGKVEKQAGDIAKRFRLQDAIVATLYTATALALMAAAPNTLRLLRHVDPDLARKRHPDRRLSQALSRLRKRGFITTSSSGKLELTSRGKIYAEIIKATGRFKVPRPRKWDGRWRIVIFDIWERRRAVRTKLRAMLQNIGFVKVQDSVWAYPYDCEELVALIRTDLRAGNGILYMIAEGLEGDTSLRHHFDLK